MASTREPRSESSPRVSRALRPATEFKSLHKRRHAPSVGNALPMPSPGTTLLRKPRITGGTRPHGLAVPQSTSTPPRSPLETPSAAGPHASLTSRTDVGGLEPGARIVPAKRASTKTGAAASPPFSKRARSDPPDLQVLNATTIDGVRTRIEIRSAYIVAGSHRVPWSTLKVYYRLHTDNQRFHVTIRALDVKTDVLLGVEEQTVFKAACISHGAIPERVGLVRLPQAHIVATATPRAAEANIKVTNVNGVLVSRDNIVLTFRAKGVALGAPITRDYDYTKVRQLADHKFELLGQTRLEIEVDAAVAEHLKREIGKRMPHSSASSSFVPLPPGNFYSPPSSKSSVELMREAHASNSRAHGSTSPQEGNAGEATNRHQHGTPVKRSRTLATATSSPPLKLGEINLTDGIGEESRTRADGSSSVESEGAEPGADKVTPVTDEPKPVGSLEPTDSMKAAKPAAMANSSEKSPRRRRRARVDYVEEADIVEPTSEDLALLKTDGFRRVSHRFWDGKAMDLGIEDIARLNPRIYVNDTIIWFYLRWFMERLVASDPEAASKILLLDTFFYFSMRNGGDTPAWATKLHIEDKRVIVMPIHEASHWSVAIIAGLGSTLHQLKELADGGEGGEAEVSKPAVIVLDSLGPRHNHHTFRKVVSALGRVLRAQNLPVLRMQEYRSVRAEDIPVQTNLTDCGVYLLHYVEQILAHPDEFLQRIESTKDRNVQFGAEFWKDCELPTKRDDLKRQLRELGQKTDENDVSNDMISQLDACDEDIDEIEIVGMGKVLLRKRAPPREQGQAAALSVVHDDGAQPTAIAAKGSKTDHSVSNVTALDPSNGAEDAHFAPEEVVIDAEASHSNEVVAGTDGVKCSKSSREGPEFEASTRANALDTQDTVEEASSELWRTEIHSDSRLGDHDPERSEDHPEPSADSRHAPSRSELLGEALTAARERRRAARLSSALPSPQRAPPMSSADGSGDTPGFVDLSEG